MCLSIEEGMMDMNLSIHNLNMIYPNGKAALKQVDMELSSPSFIGLLGPNGAGKSTLMKLLIAALLPTDGDIQMDGEPLNKREAALRSKLGYLPQRFGLYDELTVWQFLDYMCALKGIRKDRQEIDRVIADTNLDEKRKARLSTLSGGQRQRVGIAQALLGKPELLIFDEPTVGLDPEERINFRNLFSRNATDKIVLLSTHIVEDVQSVCNRVIVLNQGKILYDGSPQGLLQTAEGHVGAYIETERQETPAGCKVTDRKFTAQGVTARIVGDRLPDFAQRAEPSLEDAYMYLLAQKEMAV